METMSTMLKDARDWLLNPARPVQIVQFPEDIETGTPKFFIKRLNEIIARGNAQKLPTFIISITGVLRSGKSFLLNLMKTYLDYYTQHGSDAGWEECEMLIEGGGWAQSKGSVTHGIWMWDHPFIIKGTAILLMDCQGTGDSKMSSPTLDNLILYMGVQTANVQILNLKGVLQSSDLERLDLCADYADADPEGAAIFESLIFLVRDWEHDEHYGEKKNEFKETIKDAKSPIIKRFGAGIEKAFRSITTYAFPHPGKIVTSASESDKKKLTVKCIEPEYLKAVKELFKKLFVRLPNPSTLSKGKKVVRRFKALKERTVDTEFGRIRIQTASEALEESLINRAFVEASSYYDQEMTKVYSMDLSTDQALEDHLRRIVDDTIERFTTTRFITKYRNSPTTRKYLMLLKQKEEAIDEKTAFFVMARKLHQEKVEYEKKFKEGNKELEQLKQQQKRLAEEAVQKMKEERSKQAERQKTRQVVLEERFRQEKALAEKEAEIKKRAAMVAEQENIAEERKAAEAKKREEEQQEFEEKQNLLQEGNRKREKELEIQEATRERLRKQAAERLRQERKRMIETAEQLGHKTNQNVLNEEETWMKQVKKEKDDTCIIL